MAAIEAELMAIRTARPGTEIRQAIHDALNKLNTEGSLADNACIAEQLSDITVADILDFRYQIDDALVSLAVMTYTLDNIDEVIPDHESRISYLEGLVNELGVNTSNAESSLRSVKDDTEEEEEGESGESGSGDDESDGNVTITYKNYNGSETVHTETVEKGGNGTFENTLTRESTNGKNYTACGWSKRPEAIVAKQDDSVIKNVTEDLTVYAAYTSDTMRYVVVYCDFDGTPLQNGTFSNLAYGSYTPKPIGIDTSQLVDSNGNPFVCWNPLPSEKVTGDATYVASSEDITDVPSYIHVDSPPYKTEYQENETMDYDGIVVRAYKADGTVFINDRYKSGIIPRNELIFPVTVVTAGGNSGDGSNNDNSNNDSGDSGNNEG